MVTCPACQHKNMEGRFFCKNCGVALRQPQKADEPDEKVLTGIFKVIQPLPSIMDDLLRLKNGQPLTGQDLADAFARKKRESQTLSAFSDSNNGKTPDSSSESEATRQMSAVDSSTPPAPTADEKAWMDLMVDDRAYGLHKTETGAVLMLQPKEFYNQRTRLLQGQLVLGRVNSSREHTFLYLDFPGITDLGVSRLHCALVPMENGIGVLDMGSTNGTRLNRMRLSSGRIYKLSPDDHLEPGNLILKVHFIRQDVFLSYQREKLCARFSPEARDLLQTLQLSTEAMGIILQRLPNRPYDHLQILTTIQQRGETVTLELLHRHINKVADAPAQESVLISHVVREGDADSTLLQKPAGLRERLMEMQHLKQLKSAPLPLQGEESTTDPSVSPIAKAMPRTPETFLIRLYNHIVEMEKQLRDCLTEAEQISDPKKHQEAVSLIRPLLTHTKACLPLIKAAIDADRSNHSDKSAAVASAGKGR